VRCAFSRIKSRYRLEVRLAPDERGVSAATGLGFALGQLLAALPAVVVAGIPSVERAVVTWDDASRRCASGNNPKRPSLPREPGNVSPAAASKDCGCFHPTLGLLAEGGRVWQQAA
jgi:hypothetical protein